MSGASERANARANGPVLLRRFHGHPTHCALEGREDRPMAQKEKKRSWVWFSAPAGLSLVSRETWKVLTRASHWVLHVDAAAVVFAAAAIAVSPDAAAVFAAALAALSLSPFALLPFSPFPL